MQGPSEQDRQLEPPSGTNGGAVAAAAANTDKGVDAGTGLSTGTGGVQSKGKSALSAGELAAVLEKHQTWVGSGWEMGKRADLHGCDLHGRRLPGTLLADADLHRCDLHRAMLPEAELDGADLHGADLHEADLTGADLQHADLHAADLHRADLRQALLREADLHNADLRGANLKHADLTQADLCGANLEGARGLTRAQLTRAHTDAATRLPPVIEP